MTTEVGALQAYLHRHKQSFELALPKHLNSDRMIRLALTSFSTNPKLRECEPASIFGAIIMASQMGLEIGVAGQGFLVPYRAKGGTMRCQFIPGWQGLVDLAQRSGRASCWTGAVFQGDGFDYELGDSPFVKHKPAGENDPKLLSHVYAIGQVKDATSKIIEVWPMKKVWHHRDEFNKVGDEHYSYRNPEMYARKVALLQVLKYLPKSIELANAITLDAAYETGREPKMMGDIMIIDPEEPPPPGGADPTKVYQTNPRKSKAQEKAAAAAQGNVAAQEGQAPKDDINPATGLPRVPGDDDIPY